MISGINCVGRKFTIQETSPFYPPRARWFSAFFALGNLLRRRMALDRMKMPRDMKVGQLVAGFFLPGVAIYLRGPRWWGCISLAACATLLVTYIVWLGYPAANLVLGLLISIHVSGFVYYCSPLMAHEPFRSRLSFTLLLLLSLLLLVYWPTRSFVQQHILTPLRVDGRVIVVRKLFAVPPVRRGEWMAYSLAEFSEGEAHNGGAIWFHGGVNLGTVLAVAGDHVTFSAAGYSVAGIMHPALPHMPADGDWIVPEKHWFVWPNLAINEHGIGEQTISGTLLRLADVSPEQFLGQPLHRWFWRQQKLP